MGMTHPSFGERKNMDIKIIIFWIKIVFAVLVSSFIRYPYRVSGKSVFNSEWKEVSKNHLGVRNTIKPEVDDWLVDNCKKYVVV